MARSSSPLAPRISAPDLPTHLEDGERPRRGGDHFQLAWSEWAQTTDASHATFTECALRGVSVDHLDLTGAVLVDVDIAQLRATTITGRGSRLRRVRISGGRIGTLDLGGADVDEVELRGIRIEYLALAGSRVTDLLVSGCTIGTLDLPQATLSRIAFADSRADDVDTRAMRAKDVDLRGLEAVSYLDPAALRDATLSPRQVEHLAPALAAALGIRVLD
ncbi:MAG: pentapeptide repeat-containing protein [Microbacterium pygmaeum]